MLRLRQAFSLVELVFGLTAGSAVFCMAIGTVERTMKLSKDGQARTEHQAAVARLCQQFRSDIHDAVSLSFSEAGAQPAPLEANNSSVPLVRYRIEGSTVVREAMQIDSGSVHRETFRLDSSARVRFDDSDNSDRQRKQLIIMRATADGELLESRVSARSGRLKPLQKLPSQPDA